MSMARNLIVSLFAFLLTLLAVEIVFRIVPSAFPDNVRLFVEAHQPEAKQAIIERLPHSPFAKPKPNVLVRIPGYYGPKDTFEYEWRSDSRGFKNLPSQRDQFDIVALGDSFTEGMGVAIEDTWTTRLSRKGHATYNLGIQGYAPTQFLGTYERYAAALKPKWVIVGLLGNVYARESQFLNENSSPDNWSDQRAPQAIGRLMNQDDLNQTRPLYLETKEGYRVPVVIRQRYRFLTSALIALAAYQIDFALNFDLKGGIPDPDSDVRFARTTAGMLRYRAEVSAARAALDAAALAKSETWISTEAAIERIASLARADGARVLLLFFPNRGTAYHRRATGQDLPKDAADRVQARLLRSFAARRGLHMIDFTPIFQSAAAQLQDDASPDQYPYLQIDGHPSPRGHEIIASELSRFLKSHPVDRGRAEGADGAALN